MDLRKSKRLAKQRANNECEVSKIRKVGPKDTIFIISDDEDESKIMTVPIQTNSDHEDIVVDLDETNEPINVIEDLKQQTNNLLSDARNLLTESHMKNEKMKDMILKKNDLESASSSAKLGICPICLENIKNCCVSATLCGHVFCYDCIINSIKVTKKCPTCRKSITKKNIHRIYL